MFLRRRPDVLALLQVVEILEENEKLSVSHKSDYSRNGFAHLEPQAQTPPWEPPPPPFEGETFS
jgi:hypothetical protein